MNSHHHTHCKHPSSEYQDAFLIAIITNGLFVLFQIYFSFSSHSTSLLADAVHNLGDVMGLLMAWLGQRLLKRAPTERSTYGMKKTSILAALGNAILLVFSCGIIFTESMYKLFSPSMVDAGSVMIVAGLGILVNGGTAALFIRGSNDLNIRGAYLHLISDALVSLGVVLSAALIYWTGWLWIDAWVGIFIALIILKGTWTLLKDSIRLIMDGVPRGIAITKVRFLLNSLEGVEGIHDLHIWALSTQENALSVHLCMPHDPLTDKARQALEQQLRLEHSIHHVTIQVEREQGLCPDACTPCL